MAVAKPLYRFGDFELDLDRRSLQRAGKQVPVSPRGFDILAALVEQRDQVLSRADIMARVWPGVSVEEHNLSVQMSKLRRVLGDTGEDGQVIATVPGRGYRFVAALDEPDADPMPAPLPAARAAGSPVWRRAAAAGAVGLVFLAGWAVLRTGARPAPPLSIVVMPLRDLSGGPGQAYLADAVTDDLTTDLAQIPGSTVIARETADSYKGRAVPVGEVGRALGVRYLLEGSLRAEGDSLHMNAQLIDTGSGAHVWAQRFDLARAGLGEARDTIVRRIASALNVELVAAESARSLHDRPDDPTALDLFFRARSILDHDDSLHGFQTAQKLLEQSVAKQPAFGDALAELGAMLLRKIQSVDDPDDQADFGEATSMIARARAASPRNARALAAQAQAMVIQGKYAEAAYAAREALGGDPSNVAALGVLASSSFQQGKLDEAGGAWERLLRINPNVPSDRSRLLGLGDVRLLQGRIAEASDLIQRSIAGDPEPRPGADGWGRAEGARMLLTAAAAMRGDVAEARRRYLAYDSLWPHRSVWRIAASASRQVAALPGFTALLAGLRQAGMPAFIDEHADFGVPPSATPLPLETFTPTPLSVPGAITIDTAGLTQKLQQAQTLLIDLGAGVSVPPSAVWEDEDAQTGDNLAFVEASVKRAGGWSRQVVVMSRGPCESASYNVVLRLVSAGQHVVWYRGGEEAWAKAGLASTDRRA